MKRSREKNNPRKTARLSQRRLFFVNNFFVVLKCKQAQRSDTITRTLQSKEKHAHRKKTKKTKKQKNSGEPPTPGSL